MLFQPILYLFHPVADSSIWFEVDPVTQRLPAVFVVL